MQHAVDGHYSRADTEIAPIPVDAFQISPDKMRAIMKAIKRPSLSAEINSGISIDNLSNLFSVDVQLLFYERAVYFHNQALYEKAINSLIFLTIVNPSIQSFWVVLALAYEKNLDFKNAIESLESALKSDPIDFSPYYGIIRCCEAMKDYSRIEELLELAKDNEPVKEQVAEVFNYLEFKK